MKKTIYYFILISAFLLNIHLAVSQIGISSSVNFTPNSKAILDISSTDKGLLIPRMTSTQRHIIDSTPLGLTVFDTDTKSFWYFDGAIWKELATNTEVQAFTTICQQKWMLKNLDVNTYRNGDTIPQVTDPTAWANLTTGAWCYYENNSANGLTYGKLYNWYAVNDPRGLAPAGWHIPTDFEWTTLSNCLGGNEVAGGKLKEIGIAHWLSPNNNATNASGFTALSTGYRNTDGTFNNLGIDTYFWNSTGNYRYILYANGILYENPGINQLGFSVRCVKD